MEKKYKIVLFDMDGTILDTLRDLSDSVNWALAECGLPQRTFAENRRFLGNGIINLIHRAVPEGTPEDLELQVRTVYKHHYEQHCNDTTKPFDGIPEALAELRRRGYKLACVSNKPDDDVARLAERYFGGLLDDWSGPLPGMPIKPAPDLCDRILARQGLTRAEAIYVGDTEVDIKSAENGGMECIVCAWGFRDEDWLVASGAKTIIHRPQELLELLP